MHSQSSGLQKGQDQPTLVNNQDMSYGDAASGSFLASVTLKRGNTQSQQFLHHDPESPDALERSEPDVPNMTARSWLDPA